ncbi:SDR family oxidoreductase [Actinomadura sp. DC4]|uniref:SDR family oxidoreductase n=1 Tax=Actinomadura sp. DC4 TaxID=3055069 RepID=UPI0025B1106F|nr:SDR family oxidoreductase [Actinomadura sp. DC4]MDN3355920.1 SDR family oxidoreductase [Actinomadura sp. DC4]
MGNYLITGAAGAIGAATAALLRGRGHDLILTGRDAGRLDATARRIGADGARTLVLDLTDPGAIEAALDGVELPPLDGVVHSAGVVALGSVAELTPGAWTEQLLVNAAAPAELTRLLLPSVRAARGHVVFVNSGSGLRANPGWSAYAASKHALRALADSLRAEEPEIRVTSVYPGRTASEMQRHVREHEGAEYDPDAFISPGTVAKAIVDALETPPDATLTDVSVRGR